MRETEPNRGSRQLWPRVRRSLVAKLIAVFLITLVGSFAFLGYLIVRLHRRHLEAVVLTAAERVSDVIKRSTGPYMLRNDREGLHQLIATMGNEPGMVRVRVFAPDGRISYSTDASEVNHTVDMKAEACYGCHAESQPLTRLQRTERFRIYRANGSGRILGIITPLENQPSCANAACHAHPASQQILGVLDTNLSLARADAQLAQDSSLMLTYTFVVMLVIGVLSWIFVWHMVSHPLKALQAGTERLSQGELGYQIQVTGNDELSDVARSFNLMSLQLRAANEQIISWAHRLEERVEQKTRELKRAHEQMLAVEKLASIGKMAAVVAHEVNNPLSGILTYAKLVRKWVDKGTADQAHREEAHQCLDLIVSESRRCGELVKNLLTFSRVTPMHAELTDVKGIVDRLALLVQHKLDMNGIQLHLDFPKDLPRIYCDTAQIEQVLLALVMNAIDAMPRGGNLWLSVAAHQARDEFAIQVRDDGPGIPAEILPQIFEPFSTTKEVGKGVGLGLAISQSIVERHRGRIEVETEAGRGTTFTVTLPIDGDEASLAGSAAGASEKMR
ncbi:MAG TPA: ATP-binding protein [Terriglobales bacterium]|nr:ATP-binding protein [Terriglobales bacterium]